MSGGIAAASVVALAAGLLLGYPILAAGGATGVGYALWRCAAGKPRQPEEVAPPSPPPVPKPVVRPRHEPVDPNDTGALVGQMLAQGRYGLLLRPQIAGNLSHEQLARGRAALEQGMALVPEGEVVLGRIDDALDDGRLEDDEVAACEGRVVRAACFFLDRYPVTNRQFYEFVAGGGYEQIALWDKTIWTAVLDFVDRTGEPGPRFWKQGCYEAGQEDHPVVGVSWYEAGAYARWLGKRLPTDAEWVKAGSWPVPLSASTRVQRKYPWGDTMDRSRANLWGSGPNTTVPVDQFPEGVSVGGVYQLIGNVWEWTRGDVRPAELMNQDLVLETPMKSVRGGAFDTYFDNQATCQFQSGEVPMARKQNIGFRCAVGVSDLMLAKAAEDPEASTQPETAPAEEVPV